MPGSSLDVVAKGCLQVWILGKILLLMHGGAAGSGAQAGNRNALKHGRYVSAAGQTLARYGGQAEGEERAQYGERFEPALNLLLSNDAAVVVAALATTEVSS